MCSTIQGISVALTNSPDIVEVTT